MSEQLLRERDYTFILVRTAVSWDPDHALFVEWRAAISALIALAKVCSGYDRDGINAYLATDPFQKKVCGSVEDLTQLFNPKHPPQSTTLIPSLRDALNYHFARQTLTHATNGEIILILLDHIPNPEIELTTLLVNATKKFNDQDPKANPYPLGISFVLVGQDPDTETYLTFLDNELHTLGAKRDIVDARSWKSLRTKPIRETLLAALTD
jgi:hypothetical protein